MYRKNNILTRCRKDALSEEFYSNTSRLVRIEVEGAMKWYQERMSTSIENNVFRRVPFEPGLNQRRAEKIMLC